MPDSPLRVLLTCRELAVRAGSQLYTRDVAETLRELGAVPVVYSPRLGEIAGELRERGVAVIDDLARLGAPPDVIHGQHHLEAMAAMLRFPHIPALFVCHGWLPWQEAPPRFPSLRHYVAVDELRRDRLVLEHGIAEGQVSIVPNFIDLDRFLPRPPLPAKPRRALLYSNLALPATQEGFARVVARACEAAGIELDVAGFGSGRPIAHPEGVLGGYDLVFARGRAAMEAMAVGAAVILCDREGDGPFVDEAGFGGLRRLNFGMGTLTAPVEERRLGGRDRALRPRRGGTGLGPGAGGERAARRGGPLAGDLPRAPGGRGELQAPGHAEACLAAASRYLSWLAPYADDPRQLALSHDRLARALSPVEAAEIGRAQAEAGRREAEEANAEARAELDGLRHSPFHRLRERLLRLRPLVAAYRASRKLRAATGTK